MELKDMIPTLANIHNKLAEINVRGDDVIRMAEVIQALRTVVFQIQKEINPEEAKE